MSYPFIFIVIMMTLMIWVPWLWRYHIRPLWEKRVLSRYLKQHPSWINIKKTEHLLKGLYKNVRATRVSRNECKQMGLTNQHEFIYGEIQFLSFFSILDKIRPRAHEKFYDLGCGGGKATISAALFFDVAQSVGIELLPGLCTLANQQLIKAQHEIHSNKAIDAPLYLQKLSRVQFINGNFLHHDFSDGDIIFINATALPGNIWDELCVKLLQLKPGSRVIVTTKTVSHHAFELIYQGRELMSWGMNSVRIYTHRVTTHAHCHCLKAQL